MSPYSPYPYIVLGLAIGLLLVAVVHVPGWLGLGLLLCVVVWAATKKEIR